MGKTGRGRERGREREYDTGVERPGGEKREREREREERERERERERREILHPLCTSTHDSVRHPTDKCSTAHGIPYPNLNSLAQPLQSFNL